MGSGVKTVGVELPTGETLRLRLTLGSARRYQEATVGRFDAAPKGVALFSGGLKAVSEEFLDTDWLTLFETLAVKDEENEAALEGLEDKIDVQTFVALAEAVAELSADGSAKEVDPEDPTAAAKR